MKIILCLISLCFYFWSCNSFSAGSYAYAEIYHYDVSANNLINKISSLKEKDSTLVPPTFLHLTDGKSDSLDHWYSIYFYNKNKNEIIFIWIRANGKQSANLAFVGVNQGLSLGNWKYINKDYQRDKNNKKKEEFRQLILDKIDDRPDK